MKSENCKGPQEVGLLNLFVPAANIQVLVICNQFCFAVVRIPCWKSDCSANIKCYCSSFCVTIDM